MKVAVLLVLVAVAGEACGGRLQVHCGKQLARTLAVLCVADELVQRADPQGPWLQALPMPSAPRDKHGLLYECCFKTCYIEDLLSYCY